MNKNKSQDSYEKIFEELEKIVQKMDSGDISLEKSLDFFEKGMKLCLLYTSPSPRDGLLSRMPSSA